MYTSEELKNINEALSGAAPGSVPAFLLTDLYGTDWLDWEPEAIRAELIDHQFICSERTFDALIAIQSAITSDEWAQKVKAFIPIVNAIGGEGVDPQVFDPAEIDEICWTVFELSLFGELDSPSVDVVTYIKVQAREEGYIGFPSLITKFIGENSMTDVPTTMSALEMSAVATEKSNDIEHLKEVIRARAENLMYRLMRLPFRSGDRQALLSFISEASK